MLTWWASLSFSLAAGLTSPAEAKPPQVRFDVAPAVACRDVTDEAFLSLYPGERLFEVRLEISSLISGDAADLAEYFFRMTSGQRGFRIVDYAPRTILASDYAGGIAVEEKAEQSGKAGVIISGPWQPATASGHLETDRKQTLTRKYELVAPLASVSASGTIEQGQGVYFKLRPSRQTSLEGSKEFQLVFRAPAAWRAGILHLFCEARGVSRGIVRAFDEPVRCGALEFPIALYRAGDEEARVIAERYALSSQKLRLSVADSQEEIQRRSYPTLAHELGGLLELTEPKIPPTWLQQILNDSVSGHGFENYLPAQVRSAAADYLIAKRELRRLTQ